MTDEQITELAELSRRHLIEERCAAAKWLVEHDLSELDLYLHTMEKFIEQSEARAVESLEPHARGKDDGEFWAEYYPVEWQQVMGAYLRRSFIVALFSVVETHLPRAVDHAGVIVRAPLRPEDLAGNLLKKSTKFLSAFAKFQAPTARDWETLNDLYAVRDSVAHGPGWVRFAEKWTPEPDGFVRLEKGGTGWER